MPGCWLPARKPKFVQKGLQESLACPESPLPQSEGLRPSPGAGAHHLVALPFPGLLGLGGSGFWKHNAEILVWAAERAQVGEITRKQADFCRKPAWEAISRTHLLCIRMLIKIVTFA